MSETTAQQKHEDNILNDQSISGDYGDTIKDQEDPADKASSFGSKMKGVFKKLNPVSPTAMTDIRILKNSSSIEGLVTKDLRDVERFPEISKVAEVRHGLDLCTGEQQFIAARKAHVRDHFAGYLDLDPSEVHPDDVPVVAFGGSGGGFRAMIGVIGYCDEMKQAGLWDVLTYVSGVSGSCWSLASYFTFGNTSFDKLIQHCKKRLSPHHPLSSDAIRAVLSAPGGALAALGPIIQKHHSGLDTVDMDLYSVFTTGYVFLHDPTETPGGSAKKEVAGYHRDWFKWSNAQKYLETGAEPMPILTAIRHERPWKDWEDKEHPFHETQEAEKHNDAKDAWFQWFEMTPYEVGCDEVEAWVPIWGFGRPFEEGKSTMQLPEQSLALLLGLCTSAPAGPLTSYLSTIERNLPKNFIGNQINNLASSISKLWGEYFLFMEFSGLAIA
jgi:cytosolic phospholipase A2